ncbi:MAG: IS3 family transposase [Methylococcales bacterium]
MNGFTKWIIKPFEASCQNYGAQRIQRDLREWGETVSRRLIGRLMRQAGLMCKTIKKFKVTTNSKHKRTLATHLLNRQFTVDEPNQLAMSPAIEGLLSTQMYTIIRKNY